MTSADPTPLIAALDIQPTYSAREASALLGRFLFLVGPSGCAMASSSCPTAPPCSRYERREATGGLLRRCCETSPQQLQTALVLDGELKSTFRELAMAAHRDTGEYKIPS